MQNQFNQGQIIEYTCGEFETEQESCEAFDSAIDKTGLFKTYSEVTGSYIQSLPFKDYKSEARIDRLLIPKPILIDSGWQYGSIGVEIKRSGSKVGPCISQCLDYMRVAWKLSDSHIVVMISHCFLWPMEKVGNALASIMEQNRIGSAQLQYSLDSEYHRLAFFTGEHKVLCFYFNRDENKIDISKTIIGKRSGSR